MRIIKPAEPEYMEFAQFEGGTAYRIPLASSLPIKKLAEMRELEKSKDTAHFDWQMAFLLEYMGDDAGNLKPEDVTNIMEAWAQDSNAQGASLGE